MIQIETNAPDDDIFTFCVNHPVAAEEVIKLHKHGETKYYKLGTNSLQEIPPPEVYKNNYDI